MNQEGGQRKLILLLVKECDLRKQVVYRRDNRRQLGILAFEGESRVVWFDGNYTEYEADMKARLGAAASQPHRIKYRQLTRA